MGVTTFNFSREEKNTLNCYAQDAFLYVNNVDWKTFANARLCVKRALK